MKNILIAIVTSFVLFCLSAGTSYYLNQPLEIETPDEEVIDDEQPTETVPDLEIEEMTNQMPVGKRPDQNLTIEAVRQMTEEADRRQKQLDVVQKEIDDEKKNVKILYEDLKRESDELGDLAAAIDSKLQAMDQMNLQLADLLAKIENQKKDLEALERKTGAKTAESVEIQQQIKEQKKWFESMDPAQAALVIQEQANQGHLELSAGILHTLESRQQAQILAELDAGLVTQLMDAIKVKQNKKGKR
ncbi:MAG: hypothetical protein AAGA30_11740 [Planctomycetota bacterium]